MLYKIIYSKYSIIRFSIIRFLDYPLKFVRDIKIFYVFIFTFRK